MTIEIEHEGDFDEGERIADWQLPPRRPPVRHRIARIALRTQQPPGEVIDSILQQRLHPEVYVSLFAERLGAEALKAVEGVEPPEDT